MRRPSYRSAAATSSTPFTRSAVSVSPNPIPPAPIKPILIRSFADTCRSDSGSGSRMNVFGEPLARANDPAAIAPAAAVLMNFRREFFSALLSDLRITSLLQKFWVELKIRFQLNVWATTGSTGSTGKLRGEIISFIHLPPCSPCSPWLAFPYTQLQTALVDLQFFADFLHSGDHILQLLSRGPSRSLAQSAIGRKR